MTSPPFWGSGLRFACTQCSHCCRHESGFVFLTRADLDRLCAYLEVDVATFVERFGRWVPSAMSAQLSLDEQDTFDCIFWRDGGCTVYEARPVQCRTYPFWPQIVDRFDRWQAEAASCPGIGIGRRFTEDEVRASVMARRERIVQREDV